MLFELHKTGTLTHFCWEGKIIKLFVEGFDNMQKNYVLFYSLAQQSTSKNLFQRLQWEKLWKDIFCE